MDKKDVTRTCSKCHREVAEANFALHETHCSRFLCLCPDCEEAVPREHLNQHIEDYHTQVKCSKCNQRMECRYLKDHESDECVERLQSCQFCQLELRWKELDEHSLVCGSRTELCRDCGHYVTLRDQHEHRLTCSDTDKVSGPPQSASKIPPDNTERRMKCHRCLASFPAEDIEKHERECVPASGFDDEENEPEEKEENEENEQEATSWLSSAYKATSLSDRSSRGPLRDGGDPYEISTCPHCHLALPLLTLRWHEVKCQLHILMK